jgi:hypothetical protein
MKNKIKHCGILLLAILVLISCKEVSKKPKSTSVEQVVVEAELDSVATKNEVSKASSPEIITKVEEKVVIQEPIILPKGTILFLKSTKTITAKNFNAGDHFFVELDKNVAQKGKVLIPKGTIVQMKVLVSDNNNRRASEFAVTVDGFIIDNYLQHVKTEIKVVTTEDKAGGTIKKAAIGAGVGAAFGGGKGAGKGAAVVGAAGLLSKGEVIQFPVGTQATFQLEQSLTIDWL